MTRWGAIVALSLTTMIAASLSVPDSGAAKRKPTFVGLGLREYRISVYRPIVRTGSVVFNLKNFGEDRHDVQVSGPGGYISAASPEVAPFGGTDRLTVRLKRAGTYTLICTLPAHAALGMKAKLTVRKPVAKRAP